jgi:uncharacterized membrane protein YebE (DUF533 family)
MFNSRDLLGGLLQSGLRGSSMDRIEHGMGQRGLGGAGGPLGQILGQLGGGAGATGTRHGTAAGGGDPLGGLAGMADRYLGGGSGSGSGRGGIGGRDLAMGGLGALAGSILSRRGGGGYRRSSGGGNLRGAMGAGGLALLGMLAMKALRNSGQQPAPGAAAPQPAGNQPGGADDLAGMLPDEAISDRTATLVVRAMISAAKADGEIDATERQRILGKVQEDGTDPEELRFLEQEMARPPDPDGLAAEARDPAVAAQVYGASLLAIKVDTPAEQAYLRDLAGKLGLDRSVVAQLHQALGAPAP